MLFVYDNNNKPKMSICQKTANQYILAKHDTM